MEERRKVILREMQAELKATIDPLPPPPPPGVESLFNKSGCDGSAILEMLGGSAGVSDSNLLQYLGLIEQRANELLQLHSFVHVKESSDPAAMATFLQGRAPKHQGGPVTVQAPCTAYVCACICVCVHVCIHVCVCVCMCLCMCVCLYLCAYMCVSLCTCTCV